MYNKIPEKHLGRMFANKKTPRVDVSKKNPYYPTNKIENPLELRLGSVLRRPENEFERNSFTSCNQG